MTDRPQHPGTPEERAERLRAIHERLDAATIGPWESDEGAVPYDPKARVPAFSENGASIVVAGDDVICVGGQQDEQGGVVGFVRNEDAAFAAHAREDVPWLLSEVAALERERDEALATVERVRAAILARAEFIEQDRTSWGWRDTAETLRRAAALAGTAAPRPQEETEK